MCHVVRPKAIFWLAFAFFTTTLLHSFADEQINPLVIWYPFLKEGKWGYIDQQGNWKIQPKFDGLFDIFDHDTVRVWVDKKCGMIDRTGTWIIPPQYNDLPPSFGDTDYRVVSHDKKAGIIDRRGKVVLPVKYDEVVIATSSAWVRKGDKLGVFGFDRKWIHEISIPWSKTRSLIPTKDSSDIAWIQNTIGKKTTWGVIDATGKILFVPHFAGHIIGPKESEDWDHPEGTDFHHGRAWVVENGQYQLITSSGNILCKSDFETTRRWSDTLCYFTREQGYKSGLVDEDGKIVLGPEQMEIKALVDGMAQYSIYRITNGTEGQWISGGYITSEGHIIVEPGKYFDCHDFSEDLASVSKQSDRGGHGHDPRAVFLDKPGHEVLSFDQYYGADSFSDGLAAVMELGNGSSPNGGQWGFIDKTGREQIAPKFGWTKPFYRGRAWACSARQDFDSCKYAMIDTTGKVLTDFRFCPPECDKEYSYPPDKLLEGTRWRGDLVVINSGWQIGLGLATADGKILVEPQFNELGPLADGVVRTITLKGEDRWTGYLDEKGSLAVPAIYTGGGNFEKGSAWVTLQPNDHRVHPSDSGWLLIDHQGREITSESYLNTSFIVEEGYQERGCPRFLGDLACVASANTFFPYGDDRLKHLNWGYIDHAGKVIAWHQAENP